jgi:uncharacterized cupin superfamily protein
MQKANIARPQFHYDDEDPEGFRSGLLRLGPSLGAALVGTSVYELPPGQAICPYHYECNEEEWLIVLEGRPTLRHPEGTVELEPWDVVCFPAGPDGAHAVRNGTDQVVRVLMYANRTQIGAVVYPDSDKIGVWTPGEPENLRFRRSSSVDYWDGEVPPRT